MPYTVRNPCLNIVGPSYSLTNESGSSCILSKSKKISKEWVRAVRLRPLNVIVEINQSISQSINQSNDQSINQSISKNLDPCGHRLTVPGKSEKIQGIIFRLL